MLEDGHDAALAQHQREVERTRYTADAAERRYRAVDPDNRLVARGLEADWERALSELADAKAELARRHAARPRELSDTERAAILALGHDLDHVWTAATTTDKDRKQLLHTLLAEVNITLDRDNGQAQLVLRWKGGAITDLVVPIKRSPPPIRTDEDTLDLVRRLAVRYPDAQIAGILNRQGRHTPRGLSYTAARVQAHAAGWVGPLDGYYVCAACGSAVADQRALHATSSCSCFHASTSAVRWIRPSSRSSAMRSNNSRSWGSAGGCASGWWP